MATTDVSKSTQELDAKFYSMIENLSTLDKSIQLQIMKHIAALDEEELDKDPILKLSPEQSRNYWLNHLAGVIGEFEQKTH